MKLTVVIVNYNVKSYLYQCLHSVERAITGMSAEIIVVDNNSTDGSVQELSALFPAVTFIENKENLGFSKANNQAVQLSKGKYILLLNPDTIVGEDVLQECVSFMDNHTDSGAVGVKMLKANGGFAWESRRGVPTPFTSFCKMAGLGKLFPKSRLFGKYYMRYLDENEVARIDIVSGAFMMLRRSALDKVGLLDETFFMYGEDIDLSYRLLKGGYYNYYLPYSIIHYKGESTQKTSFRYVRNFYKAMLIFYKKHFGDSSWLLTFLIRVAIYFRGSIEFLFRQHKHLDILPEGERYCLLVVGSEQMCETVESLCSERHIKRTFITLPQEEIEKSLLPSARIALCRKEINMKFTHVVFNIEDFNYSDVFAFMQREHQRKKDSVRMRLGLYSPKTQTLVFESDCYKL